MPFEQKLADRLQKVISEEFDDISGITENRMMGGFGYMLNGNMCVGIHKDLLIIRVGQPVAKQIIQQPHVGPMDFTGKVMKAWATVEPPAMKHDKQLTSFCQLAIDFVSQLPAK